MGDFWWIRPLIIVPVAGGLGGGFFYIMNHLVSKNGWLKVLLTLIGVVGFIVAIWLGSVLGLDGTFWD